MLNPAGGAQLSALALCLSRLNTNQRNQSAINPSGRAKHQLGSCDEKSKGEEHLISDTEQLWSKALNYSASSPEGKGKSDCYQERMGANTHGVVDH